MKSGRGVWYIPSVNTVRRVAEASWLMLSSTLLFAGLPDLRRPVRGITLPSLTREVWTTEDACLRFVYLVLRNTHRPNVKSPDYLPNLPSTLDRDGNADSNWSGWKKFLGHIDPGNFSGKAAYVSQN